MENISPLRALQRSARPILAGFAAGLCFIWVQSAHAEYPQHIDKEAKTCKQAIHNQERRANIPKGLLKAISFAESGRWNAVGKATIAWPWTVTTGGKGYFLPNRADAIAFVKSLRADGVENIDVGCMQINLKYHPDAFASIAHAFDPNTNAAYAADFLSQRFAMSKSWIMAAGDYHSTTPNLNKAYRNKVSKLWNDMPKAVDEVVAQVRPSAAFTRSSAALIPPSVGLPRASRPNALLTKRFNLAFRSRSENSRSGLAIANRANALKPGASINRPKGKELATQFTNKRQSQLMAWRKFNHKRVPTPTTSTPLKLR